MLVTARGTTRLRCPSCDHDNRPERRFCTECGAGLSVACPACGAPIEAGEKFCGGCGVRLPSEAPAIAVSAPARDSEAAVPAGERRQLTVLFCDLVGSTPLSQQLDAEEWREVIAQYQQAAAGAVGRFGGHVAENLGQLCEFKHRESQSIEPRFSTTRRIVA